MTDTNTPMMLQYRRAKAELDKGTILFFRLGDFFEMFFDDALTAAPLLDVALTKRQGIPMCGVPFHAVNLYAAKLLKSGFKVALCDQLEDPKLTNKLVQRGITAVLTPGTLLEENMLQSQQANYLARAAFAAWPFWNCPRASSGWRMPPLRRPSARIWHFRRLPRCWFRSPWPAMPPSWRAFAPPCRRVR